MLCLILDTILSKLKNILQAIRSSLKHFSIIFKQVLVSKKINISLKFVKGKGISCLFIILLIKELNLLINKFACKYKQIR